MVSACKEKAQTYHDNGSKHEVYPTDKEGKRHGQYQRYNQDGQLFETATYTHGLLDGSRTIYYPDGQVEIEEIYVSDKLHGTYKKFHQNGQLQLTANYEDNVMTGPSKSYYEDGTLKEEILFKNNEENGPFVEYHPNGQPHWKGTYAHGDNEVGDLLEFDTDGQLIKKMLCDDRSICRTIWTLADGDIAPKSEEL